MHGDDTTVSALLLGRYRVEGVLGEGGIGNVVRAFDQRLRRMVAIKSLKRTIKEIVVTGPDETLYLILEGWSSSTTLSPRPANHTTSISCSERTDTS